MSDSLKTCAKCNQPSNDLKSKLVWIGDRGLHLIPICPACLKECADATKAELRNLGLEPRPIELRTTKP